MGTLIYNGGISLAIDDRTMAHLQVVIINKLRRRESFTFTWDSGTEQTVCWIAPPIAIEFVFSGNRRPVLNRSWLELLALSANANSGLMVMPEPIEAPQRPVGRPAERVPGGVPEPVSV
jgi:hypothetical protein